MKRNDGLPFFMFYITYIVGEHIVLPRNAISNVFSGAHGAPLRLGKAQMSYIRCDESSHPTVKCVDKYNSQAPCMITRQKSCGEQPACVAVRYL